MKINQTKNGTELLISLSGRLDTMTAPELENEAREALPGITKLDIDMRELDYISSAGLRVLLTMQKAMNKQGTMRVLHANETVREVLDITGFANILTLE